MAVDLDTLSIRMRKANVILIYSVTQMLPVNPPQNNTNNSNNGASLCICPIQFEIAISLPFSCIRKSCLLICRFDCSLFVVVGPSARSGHLAGALSAQLDRRIPIDCRFVFVRTGKTFTTHFPYTFPPSPLRTRIWLISKGFIEYTKSEVHNQGLRGQLFRPSHTHTRTHWHY